MSNVITNCIRVFGIVQGVGFRPTVSRHAMECGITGTVCNKGPYVEIFAQGSEAQVKQFQEMVEKQPPRRAVILKLDCTSVDNAEIYPNFEIIESEKEKGDILISPDIGICEECKKELFDPSDRRYLHPFINCTCCGPRLTILEALPYDRERTSMRKFPMCPDCKDEYENPMSRRYDAQPVCCNDCGPEVFLLNREETGSAAITIARQTIHDGGIVAVKGIGGFHLCCDATNQTAVQRLRLEKNRPVKPFAVMMKDIETVKKQLEISSQQEVVLTGHQKPIVLLRKKEESSLCEAVAPRNPKVGVMLPYAPLQLLLFEYPDGIEMPDALVMTSGNDSGAPICKDESAAEQEVGHLCDAILAHNREIRIRADDTVMDFYENREYMIRRSRGYAPLPFLTSGEPKRSVLAVGGELKNSFCIGVNRLAYLSPYIGDMGDVRTIRAFQDSAARFMEMLETEPDVVACDLHPRYNTTELAKEYHKKIVPVQHHYAHVISCMAENDALKEAVIGVALDGTGYGTDGSIWGGEILISDCEGFERIASIRPFLQIGGDLSAKEGWRIAMSMLYGIEQDKEKTMQMAKSLNLCSEQEAKVMMNLYDRHMNAVDSTSAGRLFDGVSAILGICRKSTFEGDASTALQFAAERFLRTGENPFPVDEAIRQAEWTESEDGRKAIMPTEKIVAVISREMRNGQAVEKLAYYFHDALAWQIVDACKKAREVTGLQVVALSGGCYQNVLLLDLTKKRLEAEKFSVLIHNLVPPNDGGIALGQATVAMYRTEI